MCAVMYGLVALFAFAILPYAYFFYDEKDDGTPRSVASAWSPPH